MADLFRAILKASKLARAHKPLSAAFAIQEILTSPLKKPKRKRSSPSVAAKPAVPKKAFSKGSQRPAPGTFVSGDFASPHGPLHYKLYTPKGSARRRMPLIVMLHGCSQSAAEFASGTRMNKLADEVGALVLYPQQSSLANLARCWNWHSPDNQARGRGEPAAIAGLTRHVIQLCRANPARVFIAGLSAGGAAAAIIGAAYPDLYAAVGVHSGVARGNIRSLSAALAAMQGKKSSGLTDKPSRHLPMIVFHGDSDRIVHPSNAGGFLKNLERSSSRPLICRSYEGCSPAGRHFTRRIYKNGDGHVLLEDWTVHGSGHSWSGGSAAGSHTDPGGPDASQEMLRFFLSQKHSWKRGS